MQTYKIEIAKTGKVVEIREDELVQASVDFLMQYGLRQILNDCHSQHVWKSRDGKFPFLEGAKGDETQARGDFAEAVNSAVNAKVLDIKTGSLHVRRGRTSDPLAKRVRQLAINAIKSNLIKKGLSWSKLSEDAQDLLIEKRLEAQGDQLTKIAKAQLKREAEESANLDEIEIDLEEIASL